MKPMPFKCLKPGFPLSTTLSSKYGHFFSKKTRWWRPKSKLEASERRSTNQWLTSRLLCPLFIQSTNWTFAKLCHLLYSIKWLERTPSLTALLEEILFNYSHIIRARAGWPAKPSCLFYYLQVQPSLFSPLSMVGQWLERNRNVHGGRPSRLVTPPQHQCCQKPLATIYLSARRSSFYT